MKDNKPDFLIGDTDVCPSCHLPFSEHNNGQIVKCALAELEGKKCRLDGDTV